MAISCTDELELNDPGAIGDNIALANDANVKAVLLGGYNALSNGAFFGGNTLRNSELLAANGEIVWSGTFSDPSDIFNKEMAATSGDATNLWLSAYNAINIVNNVLSALDVVNAADQDQVEGEALFIRGIAHFELVRFFGLPYSTGNASTNLGVPIMLTPNSVELVSRNTVEEVYTQVIDDLEMAESLLADGPNNGKASKQAAAAILSRVYLQMGNYVEARDAANRVISSGIYDLMPTIASCFNTGSTSEDIFDIPVSTADGINNMQTFYASTANGGRGDVEIQAAHVALYDGTDDRLDLIITDPVTLELRSGKWLNAFGNVKIVRLAEMYLTRAECNQRLGTSVGDTPLNDINEIRSRSSLDDLGAVTLGDILLERRLELAHEGSRIHDVKRLQETITEGVDIYSYSDPLLVFPIPQREIDVNGNLIQNQGY